MGKEFAVRKKRLALLATTLCLVAGTASADDIVRSIDWQALASANTLSSGTVVAAPDGVNGSSLRVDYRGTSGETFGLLTLDQPEIGQAVYALKGRVRYDNVEAGSYFEMWNHLPDGAFFSRSLEESGPMGRLDGSSPWRDFVLPFFNQEGGEPPDKLVFNLVLTGPGTVEIGPLQLVEFDADENIFASSPGWWNDRQAGLIGGIIGSGLGLLGAAIGFLGSAGRARGFVLGGAQSNRWPRHRRHRSGRACAGERATLRCLLPFALTGNDRLGAWPDASAFDEQAL